MRICKLPVRNRLLGLCDVFSKEYPFDKSFIPESSGFAPFHSRANIFAKELLRQNIVFNVKKSF